MSVEGGTTLKVTDESLAQAARVIRDGGLVVIPTDTVYGVACDPRNKAAIDRIYRLKRRPRYKALQVLLASTDQLDELSLDLPSPLNRLSAAFLPGAFSPIAVADDDSPLLTVRVDDSGARTQGIRVPDCEVTLRVLRAIGPVAASSANRSGNESAQTVDEAVAALGDSVDLYIDGGPTVSHTASTVVAADPDAPDGIVILREGRLEADAVRRAVREEARHGGTAGQ